MREKKIAQERSAQIEFGFKIEKIATNENVYYHFIEKEKKRIVFFMLNKYLGLKNRKPNAEIDFVEFHFERWRGKILFIV